MNQSLTVCVVASIAFVFGPIGTFGREWTDKTGHVKIHGTLLAADDKEVVIKLDKRTKERELLAVSIEDLSLADQEYIQSKEALDELKADGDRQVWELKNGMKVFGRVVGFVRKEVVIQRRRGKLYVNDRPFDNLPEVYQRMVPHVVEHFEKTKFEDEKQFDAWVRSQKTNINKYPCEGVMIEFPNGDEYALPFFFLTENAMASLKPEYEGWVADLEMQKEAAAQHERQRQHDLYVQSQAAAYQQNQQEMLQIARLQLMMNAVAAGATDLWEVGLYPPLGVPGYPIYVVVPGRNSDQASFAALQSNPGYRIGPIRKLAGF